LLALWTAPEHHVCLLGTRAWRPVIPQSGSRTTSSRSSRPNTDSDVRKAFNLKPAARWKSLGSEINRLGWLISIHVIIDVDSGGWTKCSTIGDITTYLNGLYADHKTLVAKISAKSNLGKILKSTVPV
jgi:hypothetical protein